MNIKFKKLDVRPIIAEGKSPCDFVFPAASSLKPGEGLLLISPFLPSPLIEKLKSEGFQSSTEHQRDGSWHTRFWK